MDISKELGLPPEIAAISFPAFTIPGFGAIGESFRARFSLESHSVQQYLTWLRGRQSIKFGLQLRVNRTNFSQANFPAGQFAMSPSSASRPPLRSGIRRVRCRMFADRD